MAEVTINEAILSNIGDAIRNKLSVETTYKPSQMAGAISSIEIPKLEQRMFSSNGEYLPNYGKNGMSKVIVDVVPSYSAADEGKVVSGNALVPQSSISISQNGSYDTTLNNQVIVDVVPNLESISISQNGTFTPSADGFSEVVVDVQPTLGSISISENGTYTPSDVDGFNRVVVNVAGGGGGGGDDNFLIAIGAMSGSIFESGVSVVGIYAFYSNQMVTGAEMQNVVDIGGSAFEYCSALTFASFPACSTINNYAFYDCRALTTVSFPACSTINNYAFNNCRALTFASFPACSTIGGSAFQNCRALQSLYLLSTSVCSLTNSIAFSNTPIANSSYLGYYGSIYVPASLVSDYKVANRWSYYSDRITAYIG